MFAPAFLGIDDPPVVAAIVAACGAIVLAALNAVISAFSGRLERRRELYGKAYKEALAWQEMLYRVRRRASGDEADRALIDRFHQLQEEIDFNQGWITSESPWMGRSYRELVARIKAQTKEAINNAWNEPNRRLPAEGRREEDYHPNCSPTSDRFLFDVRCHLSVWVFPKLAVVWRNRKLLRANKPRAGGKPPSTGRSGAGTANADAGKERRELSD